MKLTAKILLQPNKEQKKVLLDTLQEANTACNEISSYAFQNKCFSKFNIQKAIYHPIKESFNLSAQVVVRCISKVSATYQTQKTQIRNHNAKCKRNAAQPEEKKSLVQATFRPYGAIAYDTRILRYYTDKYMVSIWTTNGREKIPFVCNNHVAKLLQHQQGESDLAYSKGKFFLLATCDIPNEAEQEFDDILGVDLGIVNLATDSDGEQHSGKPVDDTRKWYEQRKAALQSVGTKSAKRRLKKLSKKERLFKRDTNHCLSKKLVSKAKCTNRAIALEELSGIRKGTKVRKAQRSQHSKWAFRQLREYITYKSELKGITVLLVDPRNTSRTCSSCGHCEKANRRNQSDFVCKKCFHSINADVNAAKNIKQVAFNLPIVSRQLACAEGQALHL